ANGPATGKDTAPDSFLLALLKCLGHRFARLEVAGCCVETLHIDQRDWSLPAQRRGTLGGMDAATELRDALAACPAMVGGQGPCSQHKDIEGAVPNPLVRWWRIEERRPRARR
ncbi:hypothetical protein, partial [Xanthomonas perforans]|uniref:hypothetical protein n=1 Tax=Xanthomonas perforans TaxID=442694 RepID=UPI001F3CD272